jgi:predicted nucleotidyltransferase
VSDLYRIVRDEDGLHVDLMATIHGIRSFAGVRDRARRLEFGGAPLLVAALEDIIKSKRAAGRPRDRAVLDILEASREKAAQSPAAARRPRSRE